MTALLSRLFQTLARTPHRFGHVADRSVRPHHDLTHASLSVGQFR